MGNHVIHVEVTGKDSAKLQTFYKDVFGWTFDTTNPNYGMARWGDLSAGVGAAQDGGAGLRHVLRPLGRPQGRPRQGRGAGGRVIMPLTEVAPETTIALFADPEGHVVGLM